MICACGRLFPVATVRTKGRCVECGRSIWLQAAARLHPDSEAIAERLNALRAPYCACSLREPVQTFFDDRGWPELQLFPIRMRMEKTVCISICGVELVTTSVVEWSTPVGSVVCVEGKLWRPLMPGRRAFWLRRLTSHERLKA